jgi:alpha-L-fucosidase
MSLKVRFLAAAFLAAALIGMHAVRAADGPTPAGEETKAERDARMQWWREARFGLFIHWGVYSVPAGTYQGKPIGGIGEWIMNSASIPVAEYAAYAKRFNPVKFDADQWVSIAKEAGMKYIVITSKHHDGFAMFKSKASPYNIVDATPFGRDPLKELAAACRKQGLKLGFYYSQAQDWHHPGGGAYRAGGRQTDHWDPAQAGRMEDYVRQIAVPQVREILSNYGPVAMLWWDTPVGMTKEQIQALGSLLKLQPGIISNNRLGGAVRGDTETPEQFIPAQGYPGRDWETCMTMNDTWGYKSYDNNWKPAAELTRNLIDIASKGGNYLLNVGPTPEGQIPPPSVARLKRIGEWLKPNGAAIYGTSASPFKTALKWGRATQKPGKLFLHVFDWPARGLLQVPIANKPVKASLLAGAQTLEATSSDDGLTLKLPAAAPDPVASVVVLDLDGPVQPIVRARSSEAGGSFTLKADEADLAGSVQLEERGGKQNEGFWTDTNSTVSWDITVAKVGTYNVELSYALEAGPGGSQFQIAAGGAKLKAKIDGTGNWETFKSVAIGKLHIDKAGPTKISVEGLQKTGAGVMNLEWLKLTPAE